MCKVNKYLYVFLYVNLFFLSTNVLSSPHEYKAIYSFQKNGVEFANSRHIMTYNKRLSNWCINTISNTVGLFRLKKDIREENSCFIYDKKEHLKKLKSFDITNNFTSTISYSFKRTKNKTSELIISKKVDGVLVSTKFEKDIIHNKNVKIDRLIAQLFGYSLSKVMVNDKGRERLYTFKLIGTEKVKTILGLIDTIVIKKEIGTSKRSTITWYSPENNYLPVKIEQYRLDVLKFTAILENYEK